MLSLKSSFNNDKIVKKFLINVYMVRHGQSDTDHLVKDVILGKRLESDLTSLGISQAESIGKKLASLGIVFNQIYSSEALRAIRSAEIIISELGKVDSVISNKVLKVAEINPIDQGDWEGCDKKQTYLPEVKALIRARGYFFQPPNGESQQMIERRASGWLEDVLSKQSETHEVSNILIVTHAKVIKCFFHYILGYNTQSVRYLDLDSTAAFISSYDEMGWTLKGWNTKL